MKPRERDRSGVLRLSANGMRVAQLIAHFSCCQTTMRRWLHRFVAAGLKSSRHQRRNRG